jgi:ABC-type uncharacterized transport system permease subunit
MLERCDPGLAIRARDWAGNWRTLAGLWGIPTAAMMVAALLDPLSRAAVWSAALTWMGSACIANARRCGRTHCRFTGPFYLLMAALVIAYAAGALPIGDHGWAILGAIAIAGSAVLWWGSERIWGLFWPHR